MAKTNKPKSRTVSAGKTPHLPANPKIDPHAVKLSWEIISNSMAKQANGEVLRWDYNQANGELIVLLVDGRKFHSFFDDKGRLTK